MAELPEISDEMVDAFIVDQAPRYGYSTEPSGAYMRMWREPDSFERVRAGLAAALVASGWRPAGDVLREVADEMARQDAKWGIQNHPDGTGRPADRELANQARRRCQRAFANGTGTWRDVLYEEVREGFAEEDPAKLRAELVQVEAVCAQWRLAIDRRTRATALEPSLPLPVAEEKEHG